MVTIYQVGDRVPFYGSDNPDAETVTATITAIHFYPYGLRYDAILDNGVEVCSWDGEE
jgi:hypothetical protein